MCGRFVLEHVSEDMLKTAFKPFVLNHGITPSYNIAPSQGVLTIRRDNGQFVGDYFRWGLVPFWAEDVSIGNRMINARIETVIEKPAFRQAFSKRRCIIPASGFYEWADMGEGKFPYYIYSEKDPLLFFGGIWEEWSGDNGPLHSCSIITRPSEGPVKELHHRMPLVLDKEAVQPWCAAEVSADDALELAREHSVVSLAFHRVGRQVNSPAFNSPHALDKA